MQLGSIRSRDGNKPVLKDPSSSGPDPVYWVFSDISKQSWTNLTIIAPGSYGGEYPKTFGHYHSSSNLETYQVVQGEGILQLQKKNYKNETWVHEEVTEVMLVKARQGDKIIIYPDYGHSWSNIGALPLLLFDDWRTGHLPSDYEVIQKLQGLAFYFIDDGKQPKAIPNPKYHNLPEPIWIDAKEYMKRSVV